MRRALAPGRVEAVSRGFYRRVDAPHVDGLDLAGVCARVPGGLVCLHSAAEFHGLAEVSSRRAWITIPHTHAVPRFERPLVRLLRWRNPERFDAGVEDTVSERRRPDLVLSTTDLDLHCNWEMDDAEVGAALGTAAAILERGRLMNACAISAPNALRRRANGTRAA